ncbi:MAG: PocR ligand-binding domain-containing protein [Polyangiaceae bacterium]|nr:PocR ligand-binding domain-containing protein [Polyangiaceae bacterium]
MTNAATERTAAELALGETPSFEELVDRAALAEMVHSFFELFRLPIRVFGEAGQILADASEQPALYAYLHTSGAGRRALADVVTRVKTLDPGRESEAMFQCVTGALYQISSITYDDRQLGRIIVGPYLPPGSGDPPESLTALDPKLDPARLRELLAEMPRGRPETVTQIVRHLTKTLDLILFSGHKAWLTSSMHLASVRESFRDLSDKNAKLQQAFDRLKELDRLKSNFLATVSHELRTPLTSIIGYSEMLSEGIAGDLSPDQREFVLTIHEKGEQLLELIKGLLDLSKLESGTMSLRKADVDVVPVIRDVAQTLTPSARKKNVELQVHADGVLPTVWGDAERLRQVFLNLTENALKFTPDGGTVTLRVLPSYMERPPDDDAGFVLMATRRAAVEVRVEDTGIGIPEPERNRVFDAFYQVDGSSTREHGGTGLGLSIVRRLVDAHDGLVHIEENAPRGAVFVVRLPCRRTTMA